MAANPAYFDDAPNQGRRSWASNVPYEMLDNGQVVDVRPTPAPASSAPRARAAAPEPAAGVSRASDAVVGHGDSATQPTHFIAINLNRQVSVIEIPGGDISKAVAISGPYLFGEGEDLTPVKLDVTDLNGDGKADLLVDVKSEQMAYI